MTNLEMNAMNAICDMAKAKKDEPDYWTRLEHQYAGMAMQGLMSILPQIGGLEGRSPKTEIIDIATDVAHALVEKLKEKEERK